MNKNIVNIFVGFIVVLILYFINITYDNKLNIQNQNNTYISSEEVINYKKQFLNKYIDTLKNDKFEEGFNMLDSDTKNLFKNVSEYTKKINELTKDIDFDKISLKFITRNQIKNNVIYEYNIVFSDVEIKRDGTVDLNEKYYDLKEIYLIESFINNYKIRLNLD